MRRPAVNIDSNNHLYYNNSRKFDLEEEQEKERAEDKKYCKLCSVLLVFSAREQAFICPHCGANPNDLDIENDTSAAVIPVTKDDSNNDKEDFIIETASHYRSPPPGAKSHKPIINQDADEAMRFRPVGGETSRADQSRNRFNIDDPDIQRLQEMGATIVKYDEQSSSTGTLSGEELERQRQERIRQRRGE